MVGANDGITADTLCVCPGCGQLTYGARVCQPCAEAARWHAARAAVIFRQLPRVGIVATPAEYERARRKCRRWCAALASVGVVLILWGLFGGQ